jgi:hypothetical protein
VKLVHDTNRKVHEKFRFRYFRTVHPLFQHILEYWKGVKFCNTDVFLSRMNFYCVSVLYKLLYLNSLSTAFIKIFFPSFADMFAFLQSATCL